MPEKVDFSECRTILGKAYNGANGKKIAVEYEGHPYMLKFPPSGENKSTELSYTNSCISEHIASSIFNMLGVKSQETMLGTFKVGAKTRLVCACRDLRRTACVCLISALSRIPFSTRTRAAAEQSLTMLLTP